MKPSRARGVLLVSASALGAVAFGWPFLLAALAPGASPARPNALLIGVGLLGCLGMLLVLELSRGGMGPKAVALVAVLAASMVALRLPGFVAGFSAMFIVVLVAGNAFGPGFGFLLGALGTFASALFVGGLGPWLPFQMTAVGWVGMGAGVTPRRAGWASRVGLLAAYAFVASYLFGAVMNLWFWPFQAGSSALGWVPGAGAENLVHYARFYLVTSFAWDSFRAVGSAALVVLLGRPLLATLDRAARRMRLEVRGPVRAPPAPRPRKLLPGSRLGGHGAGDRVEESPDSAGQDAGESPRRGDPRKVPQKQTAASQAARVKR